MKAGDLTESVAFDAPAPISDGMGGEVGAWTEIHAARGHFRYLRGGETVLQGRLEGRQTLVVTIWNCVGARSITSDCRMRDQRSGTVYNVRSHMPTSDRKFLELTCESGVAV